MKIWLTRHGQTDYNKAHLMQGRLDKPLNETGIRQAKEARERLLKMHPGLTFDAVYSSPLKRAVKTASIIGNISPDKIIIDERIIEVAFGRYERKKYHMLGPAMSLFWALPEVFPAPKTVEPVSSMVKRSHAFLKELEQKDYENVLVVCHGGILRALCGYMEDRPLGIKWRPKPRNCEIRAYESVHGTHRFLESITHD